MEYVYIIRESDGNLYKIGRTVNVQRRIKQLSSGNSRPLVIRYSLKVDDAKKLEKKIHQQFKKFRLDSNLEWFYLSSEEVINIISFIEAEGKTV